MSFTVHKCNFLTNKYILAWESKYENVFRIYLFPDNVPLYV